MSDEENGQKKRKRPTLYKKDEKDEDVLKKLKEVRQSLQESLDDDKPPEKVEKGPIKKGPTTTRKRGERKLYKNPVAEA